MASRLQLREAMRLLVCVFLLGGCERDLVNELPDAALPDAPLDAAIYCPLHPSLPLAPGTHQLYLNTDGVSLTYGTSSSLANTTDLVPTTGADMPPFLMGQAGRDAFIAQIVSTTQNALAAYSIDIVTARPMTGAYYMVVLGGVPADIGSTNTAADFALPMACHPFPRDEVVLIYDHGSDPPYTPDVYAADLLNTVGALQGLGYTTAPADCMCIGNPGCGSLGLCTFGSNVPTSNLLNGTTLENCGYTPTEDEPALLAFTLGCR